ncbi:hypothetical protein HanRHA438_Chr03g0111601 [Helianthus annuus]|nr:hypothetical protein HanRHA438_Chr03g0111601 [Helianthus annuus]
MSPVNLELNRHRHALPRNSSSMLLLTQLEMLIFFCEFSHINPESILTQLDPLKLVFHFFPIRNSFEADEAELQPIFAPFPSNVGARKITEPFENRCKVPGPKTLGNVSYIKLSDWTSHQTGQTGTAGKPRSEWARLSTF